MNDGPILEPGTEAWLEQVWDGLLSRDPEQIRQTYAGLDTGSQSEVLEHLKRMATEEGWHPRQVDSACAALAALEG
jgi:hypothetical protein